MVLLLSTCPARPNVPNFSDFPDFPNFPRNARANAFEAMAARRQLASG